MNPFIPDNSGPVRRGILRRWGVVCGTIALSLGAAYGQGPGPTAVQFSLVERRDVSPTARLVGTVRPQLRTTIAAEVAGMVSSLPINDGDLVTKGQVLCKLRDVTRTLDLEAAQARLAELKAALAASRADFGKADFEKKRMTDLWELNRSTEKEYHDALADADAAGSRVQQAQHAVTAQEAVVGVLADGLSRTEIRSPCDGHIVKRFTEIGSWVEEGGAIAELIDLSVARVRVDVPETMIAHCRVGQPVRVGVDALQKEYTGRIARIIPDADQRARTFPVEIDVENGANELKAGLFARAAVPSGPHGPQLLVPKDAAILRGSLLYVYAVRQFDQQEAAVMVPVELVAEPAGELADRVAVKAEGLSAGEKVVVRGNEYMMGPGPVPVLATPVEAPSGGPRTIVGSAATQRAGDG